MTALKDIRLLAIDMDGTLLDDTKKISVENLKALSLAMEKGLKICISTGRAWPGVKEFIAEIHPNASVITSNGAMIVDPLDGHIIKQTVLEEEDARGIYGLGTERDTSMIVWYKNVLYGNRIDERLLDYGQRYGRMQPTAVEEFILPMGSEQEMSHTPGSSAHVSDMEKLEYMAKEGISKILWYDTCEKASKWGAELQSYPFSSVNVNTSEPQFLEFFNRKVSKGLMLEYVCDLLGFTADAAAAIGDADNDIPMLKAAGFSVAMGNACDSVKEVANFVTATNNDNGVAQFIYRVLDELT